MDYKILKPSCNLDTVRDGRGGIFTWLPESPIVEFNLLYFNPGKVRGHHYHPEFDEYFLVVEGSGTMVYKNKNEEEDYIHMSTGTCVLTKAGLSHTFYAITEVKAVAMLTKEWDSCTPPIISTS